MKKIFVINGFPGTGKTTFGETVGGLLAAQNINFLHISSIDPVKHLLRPRSEWDDELIPTESRLMFQILKNKVTNQNWDGVTKDPYWRSVMSELKASILEFEPDYINYWLATKIIELAEPAVVFVDIREPDNILNFKKYCDENGLQDFSTVYVESDLMFEHDNPSDASVRDFEYDIIINNKRGDVDILESKKNLLVEARKFIDVSILADLESESHEETLPTN